MLRHRYSPCRASWLSGLVVPHVRWQPSGVERDQAVPEDLQRREGAIGDGAFNKQSLLIVGEQFHALNLVSLDRALPTQQRRAVVDLGLEDVLAWIVAAVRRIRDRDRHQFAPDDWPD